MAQAELARRIDRPIQAINEIIKGEKAITPATALQLEKALDVPANIWVGLESRYQLIKARLEERKQLQKESAFLSRTPYKQLADLDCVERTRDGERKIRELHRFYGVSSLANLPEIKAYEASFSGSFMRSGIFCFIRKRPLSIKTRSTLNWPGRRKRRTNSRRIH